MKKELHSCLEFYCLDRDELTDCRKAGVQSRCSHPMSSEASLPYLLKSIYWFIFTRKVAMFAEFGYRVA